MLQATIISPQRHAALDARRRPRKDHLLACMVSQPLADVCLLDGLDKISLKLLNPFQRT